MIEKKVKIVLSFGKTSEAMKMDKVNNENNLPGKMIPVPREISAGCGIAYSIDAEFRQKVEELTKDNKIKVDGIHELNMF